MKIDTDIFINELTERLIQLLYYSDNLMTPQQIIEQILQCVQDAKFTAETKAPA